MVTLSFDGVIKSVYSDPVLALSSLARRVKIGGIVLRQCNHLHLAERSDDLERRLLPCVCVEPFEDQCGLWWPNCREFEDQKESARKYLGEGIPSRLPIHLGESSLELRTVMTREELMQHD